MRLPEFLSHGSPHPAHPSLSRCAPAVRLCGPWRVLGGLQFGHPVHPPRCSASIEPTRRAASYAQSYGVFADAYENSRGLPQRYTSCSLLTSSQIMLTGLVPSRQQRLVVAATISML